MSEVRRLVAEGADVNIQDQEGWRSGSCPTLGLP